VDEAATAVSLALTGAFAFSHRTAAHLWGLPMPAAWQPGELVDVMRDITPLRRAGVRGHRGLLTRGTAFVRGLPVTDPVCTWLDLASDRSFSVDHLVIAGDAVVGHDLDLLAVLRERAGLKSGRGRRRLLEAAPLVRAGSESPMETKARLAFASAALPEPELNAEVYAAEGTFLARVDFLWREAGVIVEYEGDHHRTDRRQWENDIARVRLLESLGWKVIRITASDLRPPRLARLLDQLRSLLT
jgi:hypothetical protein